jgi:hypothetical protein
MSLFSPLLPAIAAPNHNNRCPIKGLGTESQMVCNVFAAVSSVKQLTAPQREGRFSNE